MPAEAPEGEPNGVLVVLEAAGADEAAAGRPTVGKAGYYLWNSLKRVDLYRENFRIHNILSCQPPDNKLAGMPYEMAAINCCAPLLASTISEHKRVCEERGQHPTILALGVIAFRELMGLRRGDPLLSKDYHSYVHWSPKHECWVVAGYHPSYLMRGNHHELPTLLFAAQRAVEVARDGFAYAKPNLLLDPDPAVFGSWCDDYFRSLNFDPSTYLSIDIETPKKSKAGEDELAREDEEDYIILRCSFAFNTSGAVSVPWNAEYMPLLERLFKEKRNRLVGWNLAYDIPRIKNQLEASGVLCDGMLWWHVLNSALPKRLGFVTPYYWHNAKMWKHLSQETPAYYNALDALAALINVNGIERDLKKVGQWHVVARHVIELGKVLSAMATSGLKRDVAGRAAAETTLTTLLQETEAKIQQAVPEAARKVRLYKKKPKKMDGVKVRLRPTSVKRCEVCGEEAPKKPHFKIFKKKVNPCGGADVKLIQEEREEFYRDVEWKPSKVSLSAYQTATKQRSIWNRQRGSVTFDENAIRSLLRQYPSDPLYPLILDHRQYQKLRGTYIGITQPDGSIKGGLSVGRDGRIHPEFTMNPSTLRLACQNPNMQNLPRASSGALEAMVRNLVVAGEGNLFLEADYAAIESVLTAYFARWADGIRLAKLGIHSYLASHVLGRPADLTWSDADLKAYFKEIKGSKDAETQRIYNACKRCVHGSNYGMTPRKMVMSEPETFPTESYATRIQDTYFDVAAPIRKWHLQTQLEAHTNGQLRNPFGYTLAFQHVFHNVKEFGEWVRKPGEQANTALAFLPQSTAAAIIKESMLRLFFERYEEVGQYLRLQVHDSLLSEVPAERIDEVKAIKKEEMTRPIPELPLPASYGLGELLVIDVDSKVGVRWGEMG